MKPYLFEYHQPEDHLFLTEYIYEIGTFHYNWHKDLEILVVLKGEVEVCAGERLYLLKEDDMILINSNEGHATFSKSPESIAFLFRMNPDFLEQYIPDYQYVRFEFATDEISRYHACSIAMRRYMAEMMIAQIDEQGADELLFRSALYGLLNVLTKQFSRREDKNLLGVKKKPEELSQILRYIEERYKEKLTLDGVAEHFGYNSSYFSQMFRANVGINFYEFLTRRRLREAVRELDRTNKKILNIADDTGYRPYFYEDPIPDNMSAMVKLNDSVDVPVATGERFINMMEFEDYMAASKVAYIRPDMCVAGGITAGKKIAALAESRQIYVIPHNPLGPVSTAACLQLDACIPNFEIQEYPVDDHGHCRLDKEMKTPFEIKDGYIKIPDGPGLGIELIDDIDKVYPFTGRYGKFVRHEDGSIVDR